MFFRELVKSEDVNFINNYLVEASRHPEKKDLKKINFLIKDASKSVLEKIKLNLIYFLGEFGKVQKLDAIYIQFLVSSYFNSDRWIRNEILETFNKLSKENELTDEIINILAYALLEDYDPTKYSALNVIKKLDILPDLILKNLLKILEHSSRELVENIIIIIKFHFENSQALFSMLNSSENFNFLEKNAIRSLLVVYFDSIINLEAFRKKIIDSEWPRKNKTLFYNEIDTYQKILARSV